MSDAASASEGVAFAIEGPVAAIVLSRPDDQNRMAHDALLRLKAITVELRESRDVHVVAIRGQGAEYFSTGLLNPAIRAALSKDEILGLVRLANDVFDAVEALPQIVVAGINGAVRAGAVELALACDIRVAAGHARLALPEARWGGFPGAGAPVRLPAIIGRGRALDLICTGREIDAEEMARIGLVEHVFPSDRFEARFAAFLGEIAGSGPLATRGAKRIVGLRGEPGFRAARELSDALRSALEWSRDVDEGMAAYREDRPPEFTGR